MVEENFCGKPANSNRPEVPGGPAIRLENWPQKTVKVPKRCASLCCTVYFGRTVTHPLGNGYCTGNRSDYRCVTLGVRRRSSPWSPKGRQVSQPSRCTRSLATVRPSLCHRGTF